MSTDHRSQVILIPLPLIEIESLGSTGCPVTR
jgi:hypothetical protein